MNNTLGMVVLAAIALTAGGVKILRGDYKLGGVDHPIRCSDLRTPEGKMEVARLNIEQGTKTLDQLKKENARYAPGSVVNLRSCDGSVQTVTVPPGGINGQKIAEVEQKLALVQTYYAGMQERMKSVSGASNPVAQVQ